MISICPKCYSEEIANGVRDLYCSETGYRDMEEFFMCRACRTEGYAEELLTVDEASFAILRSAAAK